jgi:hypothetical protein
MLIATRAEANEAKATFDEHGLVVRSANDGYKFERGGRFHPDDASLVSPSALCGDGEDIQRCHRSSYASDDRTIASSGDFLI